MIKFHAVMIDECGGEFSASIQAKDRLDAELRLRENYPESQVAQLETTEESNRREQEMYDHIAAGGDWDDEGLPIGGEWEWEEPEDLDVWDPEDED